METNRDPVQEEIKMKKYFLLVVFCFLSFFLSGCQSKIDSKLKELAARPPATSLEEAKKNLLEAENFLRWIEKKEKPSEEQLARTTSLRNRRAAEAADLVKQKTSDAVSGVLGKIGVDIKSINPSGIKDWFLGTNDPRMKKFGSSCHECHGNEVEIGPTEDGGSRSWK